MMNAFTVVMALAAAANAHMIMKTPTPALSPNNSPLEPDGSDFPCKIPGGSGTIPSTNKNVITIGASNTLSFTGSATHGGGSCQVSLAKGNTVSKDTKWMVIHSIEGGCPASAAGNLAADPSGSGASTFQFTVPDHPDLGAGTYTLAWTWNNKIGNREMYMNCAYVDLQAASKKRYMPSMPISKRADAPLPAMFVANVGNGCTVAEGTDVQYPNPGASVEKGAGANLAAPQGNCGASGAQPATGSSSSGASSSAAASNTVQPFKPSGSAGAASTGTGSKPSGTGASSPQVTQSQGGSFATVSAGGAQASSAAAAAPTAASSSAAVASSAPAAQPTAAVPATPSNGSTPAVPAPGSGSATGTCTNGYWMCAADGKSFKRCANGIWSVDMQMAAGTACVPDSSSAGSATLQFAGAVGTHSKRDIRAHIARRAHLHGTFLS